MTENNTELYTSYKESEHSSEHKSRHRHSHHGSSHHSSRSHHHSSSRRSSSHSGHSHSGHSHRSSSHRSSSRRGSSNKNSRGNKKFSLASFLEKTSLNWVSESVPKYRKISQRVLFCLIFFGCITLAVIEIITPPKDSASKMAGQTRSETDLLKSQIIILQSENEQLEKELARYKELYGELETETQENQIP